MKKIIRITAVIVLTLFLLITLASCGNTKAASGSGNCGAGVTWAYDAETNLLNISGNGTMDSFESSADAPWASAKYNVTAITIGQGVKNIGDYAFYSFTALESIDIADSVTSIGDSAFAFSSKIENITLPSTLESIGVRAFEGCSALNTALIPSNVKSIGESAFSSCKSITVAAVLADVELPDEVFFNCISMKDLFLSSSIIGAPEKVSKSAFAGSPMGFDNAKAKDGDTLTSKVTVTYEYEDGTTEIFFSNEYDFGENYNIVAQYKEGYTAEPLSISGYADGNDVNEKIVYTKIPEEPTPEEEDVKEDEPITASTIIAIVILGVLLVGIAVAAVFILRSQKKNAGKNTPVRKNNSNNTGKHK